MSLCPRLNVVADYEFWDKSGLFVSAIAQTEVSNLLKKMQSGIVCLCVCVLPPTA